MIPTTNLNREIKLLDLSKKSNSLIPGKLNRHMTLMPFNTSLIAAETIVLTTLLSPPRMRLRRFFRPEIFFYMGIDRVPSSEIHRCWLYLWYLCDNDLLFSHIRPKKQSMPIHATNYASYNIVQYQFPWNQRMIFLSVQPSTLLQHPLDFDCIRHLHDQSWTNPHFN